MSLPHPMTEHFREAFRRHPAGVAVITADPGDRPVAMTVSSLISVSAAPPIVAFSLSQALPASKSPQGGLLPQTTASSWRLIS